ncbi:hypothetical protein [Salinimonas lutimaris]|uniref:hypothetical protein n=1 Tax=Salinimonas lutimaris TaxID=914153 RepID=UPI0010C0B528|nr:hypothetical protein [Salinimonas lutimaris]
MKLTEITHRQWAGYLLISALLLIAIQGLISLGQLAGYKLTYHHAIDNIENRISLDSAYLDIGSRMMNTPVNQSAVRRYAGRLNNEISKLDYPARVVAMQGVEIDDTWSKVAEPTHAAYSQRETILLTSAEQLIEVTVAVRPWYAALSLHPGAIIAALLLAIPVCRQRIRSPHPRRKARTVEKEPSQPRLIINLHTKTLHNGMCVDDFTMQNKPFCFYVALVKYCIDNPDAQLSHHKDVPAELIQAANGVFARLIELGHTKRKRPDFNANLDKTLSEIRSTLEEAFGQYAQAKEKYYPPRAQGEGSRSKQHSFTLTNITAEDVEIIGH